jgi:3'-phosphoadenosine 5'-phosphosulfate sulfotransferase (PAPS reductase)/FAD synthetase
MTRLSQEWKAKVKKKGKKRHGPCRILSCFGFRAQESPRRKKLPTFQKNTRQSNKTMRHVWDWLPIHDWTTDEVWAAIKDSGCPHHWAYDRGMTRLSCRFCIFSPRSQLLLSASQPENKELFDKYVKLENKIDHTFRKNQSLQEIADGIKGGEEPETADDGCWNM